MSIDSEIESVAKTIAALCKPSEEDCWIQTYTGGIFYPLRPRVEDVRFQDIAGSLSKLCRYAGHGLRFFSVAEHCVHVAHFAPRKHRLAALLHDASEAYLVDIPRPLKPWLIGYQAYEATLMRVIAERFGFEYPLADVIHNIDMAILTDEREQNMARLQVSPIVWGNMAPRLGVRLQFWSPDQAEFEFLQLFHSLYSENRRCTQKK